MRCPICGKEMGVDDNIVIFRGENIKMAERGQESIKAMSQEKHEAIHQGKEAETIVDLPADLQAVYNVLHLTEKQFEVLDNFLEKALVALMRQPKYEKIIADMAEEISDCAEIGIYCNGCQYFEGENEDCEATSSIECRAHIVKYYKQRAGIEG